MGKKEGWGEEGEEFNAEDAKITQRCREEGEFGKREKDRG